MASTPKFDFSRVTRRWSKSWRQVTMELMQIGVLIETPARDGISNEELATLNAARVEALGRIGDLDDKREELLAMVLVDVPREWLSPDAPDVINWGDPAALDWLLDARFNDLLAALAEARKALPN